jgi:hypothetical protein
MNIPTMARASQYETRDSHITKPMEAPNGR